MTERRLSFPSETDREISMAKTSMNNMKPKKQNSKGLTIYQAEKTVLLRVLFIVLFDIIASFLFDYIVTAPGSVEFKFYMEVRPVLLWVSIALFVLSIGYIVLAKVKKLDVSRHVITPEMLAAMSFIFMAAILLYNTFRLTPFLFYTMMIIVSILAVIYYIYTMLFYR